MMPKIPTAEEFLTNAGITGEKGELRKDQILFLCKEFAKIHVKAALEAAKNNADIRIRGCSDGYECWDIHEINEDSILNSYPMENIK